MSGRRFSGGRGGRKRVAEFESEPTERYERHPRHLRGKEIGLWYARQSRERRDKGENSKPRSMGTVIIPPGRVRQIRQFLNNLPPIPTVRTSEGRSYDHVPASEFKENFLDIINTNIQHSIQDLKDFKPLDALDRKLHDDLVEITANEQYNKMLAARECLPAYKMRSTILDLINNNQICLISGETGCGKTTQVPQFILDDYLKNQRGSVCKIVCSQPRRISAITVAERIAEERGETLGKSVGYQIRLECRLPRKRGCILFCTTGVILRQLEGNIGFDGISHLILDEVHERNIASDFLLALVKKIVQLRSNLKVILMSATMNADKFLNYFNASAHLTIPGFTFTVREYYLEDALKRTGYMFPPNPQREECKGPKWKKHQPKEKAREAARQESNRDFYEMIMPHVRRLEDLQLYPRQVCLELMKEASEQSTVELAVALTMDICKTEEDPGAILVFLTGHSDISKMHQLMEDSGDFPRSRYLILPLHSQMATLNQKTIFLPPPQGVRKIILATNIAETSITIEDVVFVIDCGKIKLSEFNSDADEDTLKPRWVSKANADQRRGRAGRVKPGICYHLFSQARNMMIDSFQTPEILRSRLDDVILSLKILRLGDPEEFLATCIDPPDESHIKTSLEFLKRMNALDEDAVLTPLGYHLARLPVAPQMGKMMLLASLFSCVDPILNIASSLDFKDAFLLPLGKEEICRRKKRELADGCQGDHLLFHKTMEKYESVYDKKQFCWEFFLSFGTMAQLVRMKHQHAQILTELNFLRVGDPKAISANVNSNNLSLVKAIVAASLYPKVFLNQTRMRKQQSFAKFVTLDKKKVDLHPKSIMPRNGPYESPFLVYHRKVRSTGDFVYDAGCVHTLPLIFFGDRFKTSFDDGRPYMSINDTMRFCTNDDTLNIIVELRKRLNHFLEVKACQPCPVNWGNEVEVGVLRAILGLITIEDEGYEIDDFE